MPESEEQKQTEEEQSEEIPEPWYKGPIRTILAIFLLLIILIWYIPNYAVKIDPEPQRIPSIEEVFPKEAAAINKSESHKVIAADFKKFVTPMDPVIKQTATKIAAISCDGNKICQAKALYYFVRDNIEYVADPIGSEYVEKGTELMAAEGGDCESGSLLLASLEEAIGIDAQLVLISGHAYIRIRLPEASKRYKLDDNWVYLDWTCSTCRFGEIPWKNMKKQAMYVEVP